MKKISEVTINYKDYSDRFSLERHINLDQIFIVVDGSRMPMNEFISSLILHIETTDKRLELLEAR